MLNSEKRTTVPKYVTNRAVKLHVAAFKVRQTSRHTADIGAVIEADPVVPDFPVCAAVHSLKEPGDAVRDP